MAVQPGPEPLSIPVPAVIRISKESLLAGTYRTSCNVGIFHRVVAYHSLPMMFPDLWRHTHPLSVTSSPVTIPGRNSLHGRPAICSIYYSLLTRPRLLAVALF